MKMKKIIKIEIEYDVEYKNGKFPEIREHELDKKMDSLITNSYLQLTNDVEEQGKIKKTTCEIIKNRWSPK